MNITMALDCACNNFANVNFKFLCDIEIFNGSVVLLTLLEEMNNLMKLSQAQDVFVVDYVARVKICQVDLFSHFVDHNIILKFNVFYSFKSLVDSSHGLFIMWWILDLNTSIEHLIFV